MPPVPYTKPFVSIPAQIQLLRQRGMVVDDEARAAAHLAKIGYYRLSGYWHVFRQRRETFDANGTRTVAILDRFKPGTAFAQAVQLYVFDKRLRLLFLDAIERIEVALRVAMAIQLGPRNPTAHLDPAELDPRFSRPDAAGRNNHAIFIARQRDLVRRSSEAFVDNWSSKYVGDLPIWMAIEVWDFGMAATLLENLKAADLRAISHQYGVPDLRDLKSWVRSINYVRNICSHHGRLWNRPLVINPSYPRLGGIPMLDHLRAESSYRAYEIAAVMQFLLRTMSPNSTWAPRLAQLAAEFPPGLPVSLTNAGFPAAWAQLPLWRP
ncbi:MAG: Abortive infection bacteriophage resistance protein Abi [Rhodospirillales bacterium]|nr:Abortive infection bacteriophage resistance protein Abi [Rhodospirillales bacterium]